MCSAFTDRFECFGEVRFVDILDANGLGIFDIASPRRVTFDSAAIASESPRQAMNRITPE